MGISGLLRSFRDPIRVPRISNRVPKIRKNRVPRVREIGFLQIQTGFLTFSLKNGGNDLNAHLIAHLGLSNYSDLLCTD